MPDLTPDMDPDETWQAFLQACQAHQHEDATLQAWLHELAQEQAKREAP